jgi:hypothetical protein
MTKDDDQTINFVQAALEAKYATLASQMHPQFTPKYCASAMLESVGEDKIVKMNHAELDAAFKSFNSKFEFFREDGPIVPDALVARMLGNVTARGEAVRTYGEAATLAALRKHGYASIAAGVPTLPTDFNSHKGEKRAPSANLYLKKFATPEARQAAIASAFKTMGSKTMNELALAAKCRIDGSPLPQR